MKILVTGGAGFIGSHLDDALIARGHNITVVDNLVLGRKENIEHLIDNPNFCFIEADLLDMDTPVIYLCGESFNVPIRVGGKKYVGILGTPQVNIKANSQAELDAKGIVFENVRLPENLDTAQKKNDEPQTVSDIVGLTIVHKQHGRGKVIEQHAKDFTVEFRSGKKNVFPFSVIGKSLRFEPPVNFEIPTKKNALVADTNIEVKSAPIASKPVRSNWAVPFEKLHKVVIASFAGDEAFSEKTDKTESSFNNSKSRL